jgi:hypothetical protein
MFITQLRTWGTRRVMVEWLLRSEEIEVGVTARACVDDGGKISGKVINVAA